MDWLTQPWEVPLWWATLVSIPTGYWIGWWLMGLVLRLFGVKI